MLYEPTCTPQIRNFSCSIHPSTLYTFYIYHAQFTPLDIQIWNFFFSICSTHLCTTIDPKFPVPNAPTCILQIQNVSLSMYPPALDRLNVSLSVVPTCIVQIWISSCSTHPPAFPKFDIYYAQCTHPNSMYPNSNFSYWNFWESFWVLLVLESNSGILCLVLN